VRLVFGLGTRAVERSDDDYTRLVSLNEPALRPESTPNEVRRYTQRKVDVLDLAANRKQTIFTDVIEKARLCRRTLYLAGRLFPRDHAKPRYPHPPTLYFTIISRIPIPRDLREIMHTLERLTDIRSISSSLSTLQHRIVIGSIFFNAAPFSLRMGVNHHTPPLWKTAARDAANGR
jgi:hypothetical protein